MPLCLVLPSNGTDLMQALRHWFSGNFRIMASVPLDGFGYICSAAVVPFHKRWGLAVQRLYVLVPHGCTILH